MLVFQWKIKQTGMEISKFEFVKSQLHQSGCIPCSYILVPFSVSSPFTVIFCPLFSTSSLPPSLPHIKELQTYDGGYWMFWPEALQVSARFWSLYFPVSCLCIYVGGWTVRLFVVVARCLFWALGRSRSIYSSPYIKPKYPGILILSFNPSTSDKLSDVTGRWGNHGSWSVRVNGTLLAS